MDGRHSDGDAAWRHKHGTPLHALPGFTVLPAIATQPPGMLGSRPSFYLSRPQPGDRDPWCQRHAGRSPPGQPVTRHCDLEAGSASDDELYHSGGSIASSTGELFRSISIPIPEQRPPTGTKKSLSPTPSFTYLDAKAAAAARKQATSCCASKSVLKITLTFCISFLLGMIITVIYMEVYLWRHRS